MNEAGEALRAAWKAQREEWLFDADRQTIPVARSWFTAGWRDGTEWLTARIAEAKYGECATCGKPYERYDSPGGVFYSHFEHPSDGHDATPLSAASIENGAE